MHVLQHFAERFMVLEMELLAISAAVTSTHAAAAHLEFFRTLSAMSAMPFLLAARIRCLLQRRTILLPLDLQTEPTEPAHADRIVAVRADDKLWFFRVLGVAMLAPVRARLPAPLAEWFDGLVRILR